MANVFTGNVFITTSEYVINKVFGGSVLPQFPDLMKNLSQEDLDRSIIASPKTNTNLLEFDFSFGYTGSQGATLRLKLLETNSNFEKQYLDRNIVKETINQIAVNLDVVSKETTNLKERAVAALTRNPDTIYFAYGIGDDLREWAGPFVMNELQKAELLVNEFGIKEIELFFTNFSSFFGRNLIEYANNESFSTALNRYNFILPHKTIKFYNEAYVKNDKYFAINIKRAAIKVIQDYIAACSNGSESVVLLPRIDVLIERYMKSVDSNANILKLGEKPASVITKTIRTVIGLDAFRTNPKLMWNDVIPPNVDVAQNYHNIPDNLYQNPIGKFKRQNQDKEIFDFLISLNTSTDDLPNGTESIPDFFIPLKKIGDAIKSVLPEFNLYFSTENDIKILKLWKEVGLIKSTDKQVYVFGAKSLIDEYLYLSKVTTVEEAMSDYQSDVLFDPDFIYKIPTSNYKLKMLSIKSTGQNNSSFKENALKIDELFYQTTEEQTVKSIVLKTPIFRHNIDNANVLSLSVKNSPLYVSVYNIGLKNKNILPFINSTNDYYKLKTEEFILQYENTVNQFKDFAGREYIKDTKQNRVRRFTLDFLLKKAEKFISIDGDSMDTLLPRISLREKNDLQKLKDAGYDTKELVELLALSVISKVKGPDKPFIEYSSKQEAALIELDMMEALNRLAFQVDIKTLPFFKISGASDLAFKRCILVSLENNILGFNKEKKPSYFSGEYIVKGFRHFISPSDMYSEFSLINTAYAEQYRKENNLARS